MSTNRFEFSQQFVRLSNKIERFSSILFNLRKQSKSIGQMKSKTVENQVIITSTSS